jgi:hypothetical protein
VHEKPVQTVSIRGEAPDELIFELGGERYRSGDVRICPANGIAG